MGRRFVLLWDAGWTAICSGVPMATTSPSADNPDAQPRLFTAIQEQIGLKLVPVKAPVDVIVIDHVERPSAN